MKYIPIALALLLGACATPPAVTAAPASSSPTTLVAAAPADITPTNVRKTLSQLTMDDVTKALAIATKAKEQDGMRCFAWLQTVLPTVVAPIDPNAPPSQLSILSDVETVYIGGSGDADLFAGLRSNCAAWALAVRDKALTDPQGNIKGLISLIVEKLHGG